MIPADATSVEDLENVFKRSMEVLGGPVDFVLHSIGMSPNLRKKRTYDDLDYDMLEKTLDISAVSFHKMIQAAKKPVSYTHLDVYKRQLLSKRTTIWMPLSDMKSIPSRCV